MKTESNFKKNQFGGKRFEFWENPLGKNEWRVIREFLVEFESIFWSKNRAFMINQREPIWRNKQEIKKDRNFNKSLLYSDYHDESCVLGFDFSDSSLLLILFDRHFCFSKRSRGEERRERDVRVKTKSEESFLSAQKSTTPNLKTSLKPEAEMSFCFWYGWVQWTEPTLPLSFFLFFSFSHLLFVCFLNLQILNSVFYWLFTF